MGTRIGFLITSRLKSTRLKRKILCDLAGRRLIDRVINRCRLTSGVDGVVLATSDHPEDALHERISLDHEIDYFAGSQTDVLLRLRDAAVQFGFDAFLSITADNPLFSMDGASAMIAQFRREPFDFGFLKGLPTGCCPYLLRVDPLKIACAMKSESATNTEIWAPFVRHESFFHIADFLVKDSPFDESKRLTCDYAEDLELLRQIFATAKYNDVPSLPKVLAHLQRTQSLWEVNAAHKQRSLPEATVATIRSQFNSRKEYGRRLGDEWNIELIPKHSVYSIPDGAW